MRKFFLGLTFIVILMVYVVNKNDIDIPNNAIRLRVVANSNRDEDIYMKTAVKTYLEKSIYPLLKDVDNIDDAREIIKDNIVNIENNINTIFENNNYQTEYLIKYGMNWFPEKNYRGVAYSAGEYESLVIYIGNAEGDNWWCCLFPNFCLEDANNDVEYRSFFKDLIEEIF